MPFLLVVFIIAPIVEIYVIVKVGEAIGVAPTVLLLLAGAVVGSSILKREGRKAWLALQLAISEHRIPTREVAGGALVMVGGALLIAPGFISDVIGLLCVLPPTRALLRPVLARYVGRRIITAPGGTKTSRPARGGAGREDVIEGEVLDEHDDPL